MDKALSAGIVRPNACGSPGLIYIFENIGSGAALFDFDRDGTVDGDDAGLNLGQARFATCLWVNEVPGALMDTSDCQRSRQISVLGLNVDGGNRRVEDCFFSTRWTGLLPAPTRGACNNEAHISS